MNRLICLSALLIAATLAVSPVSAAAEKQYITVSSGDTLFGLVRQHYPNQPSRWSLIENEVFLLNPHAFSNEDKSLLRVGAELELPEYVIPNDQPAEPPPTPEPPRHDLSTVGNVMELSGIPVAIDLNNEERPLNLGGDVFRGDTILTENNSEARLQMNDGAQLHLRPRSRIVIEDYSFNETLPRASRSIITLLKGGFRAITGLIGRRNPASMRINTAVATIGIRGTDFGVRICQVDECVLPGSQPFEAGNYSGVLDGEITISNTSGITGVSRGEFMRTTSADAAPEPAPEAALLIFSADELALLEEQEQKPMGFFQWLRSLFFSPRD
ncbi:MAG: FecR domain-containing protein [Planctomycetota bacterium]|nr:FecR domain-containing protein [Planctomycetota bacterium]